LIQRNILGHRWATWSGRSRYSRTSKFIKNV